MQGTRGIEGLMHFATKLLVQEARVEPLAEGFYATVFLARTSSGSRCVLKSYKHRGHLQFELEALSRLQVSTLATLPPVIGRGEIGDSEILALGWLSGVAPDTLATAGQRACFNVDAVAALAHWHTQTAGFFENPDGSRYVTFEEAYTAFVQARLAWLSAQPAGIASRLHQAIATTWRRGRILLDELRNDVPSLIHDDPHPGNFLASAETGELMAILDPGRSRYSHRELDLFHLADGGPHLGLHAAYLTQYPARKGYELRRHLFSLMDDVWHMERTGWFDEGWMQRKLAALDAAFTDSGY